MDTRTTGATRRTHLLLLAAALAALHAPTALRAQTNSNFEYGVDRPGGDYRRFPLQFDAPGLCAGHCAQDGRCRAWTYVRPGVQGPLPMCWLKSVVPAPVGNAWFAISGVRGGVAPPAPPPQVAQVPVSQVPVPWPPVAGGQGTVSAAALQGWWQYSSCGGRWGFLMGIQPTGPSTFVGGFENGRGTISNGRIVGDRISFDQVLSPTEWTRFSGRLVSEGGRLKVVDGVHAGPLQQKFCPERTDWTASK